MVGNPDLNGREQILRVHTRKVELEPDVDLRSIARGTPGFRRRSRKCGERSGAHRRPAAGEG